MKKIIIFLGAPGSGKGTQAKMIGKILNIPVVSVGVLLREEVAKKTKIGKIIDDIIGGGNLAPVEISNAILKKRLAKKDVQAGVIIDGYPRSVGQLDYAQQNIDKVVASGGKAIVFYIDINDQVVKKRIGGRRSCANCGRQFHTVYNPPQKRGICDNCGDALIRRTDDNDKSVARRLVVFHRETGPVLEHLAKTGYLYKINGDRSIKEINKDIIRTIKKAWK